MVRVHRCKCSRVVEYKDTDPSYLLLNTLALITTIQQSITLIARIIALKGRWIIPQSWLWMNSISPVTLCLTQNTAHRLLQRQTFCTVGGLLKHFSWRGAEGMTGAVCFLPCPAEAHSDFIMIRVALDFWSLSCRSYEYLPAAHPCTSTSQSYRIV